MNFLTTLPDEKYKAYGERVRESLPELFAVIHRRETISEAGFARKLEVARAEVVRVSTTRVPQGKHAQNLAGRFHKRGAACFQFITTPGIELTNNLVEQAIRFVVIDRRITQGARSETAGRGIETVRCGSVFFRADAQSRAPGSAAERGSAHGAHVAVGCGGARPAPRRALSCVGRRVPVGTLLSPRPIPRTPNWIKRVGRWLSEKELRASRTGARSGRPLVMRPGRKKPSGGHVRIQAPPSRPPPEAATTRKRDAAPFSGPARLVFLVAIDENASLTVCRETLVRMDTSEGGEHGPMILDAMPILAAAPFGVWNALWDVLVLLAMALVLGTVAERLGQSVIVGYLMAGMLVGPNVLGWVSARGELFNIAELGVALLLFAIGLEFSPRRLLALGSIVVKTGSLQIVLTAVLGFAVSILCGLGGQQALVVGMMVAMSSTACVLRLLTDRAEIDSQHGRMALGILLVQDVAVVPMMLLVSIMATGGNWGLIAGKLALALILATVLSGVFYALFNLVAPRLLLLPTWRKNRDLPVLLAVIMATGSAWATHAVGLSPAMGAFAAGVLLGASPFATQIRADTRPLTTLMVTLFFASIGMLGDPMWLLAHWPAVTGIVLAIVAGKSLIIAVLARIFGRPWRYAIASALCLAQVGEFSFVLATIAHSGAVDAPLITSMTFHAMISATILTLLSTPYLVSAAPWVGARCEHLIMRWRRSVRSAAATAGRMTIDQHATATEGASHPDSGDRGLIVIVGFGPAGQRVAEGLMESHQQQMVAVDLNPDNIEIAQRYGLKGHLGDATQREILERAGIYKARVFAVTVPDPATIRHLIHLVRDLAPDAFIVARCRYHLLHWELLAAGAHEVVDEEDQLGRRLAAQVRKYMRRPD